MSPPRSLSNSVISNFIPPSFTTNPTQHPHLRSAYFIIMLVFNNPTLHTIHYQSDKIFPSTFQLERHFRIAYQTNIMCTESILAYPSTLINSYSHDEEYFDQQGKYF